MRLLKRHALLPALAIGIAALASPAAILAQSESPAGSPGGECAETTPEENQGIVEQYVAAIDAGDTAAADALLHDDFAHNLSRGAMEVPNEPGNADELAGIPNLEGVTYTIDDIFAGGDKVGVRLTYDIAPEAIAGSTATEPVDVTAIGIVRIECGMIAELHMESDIVTALLGHGLTIDVAASPAP